MPEENTETASETISNTVKDAEELAIKTDFLITKLGAAADAAEGTLDETLTKALDVSDIELVTQAERIVDLAQCAKNIPAALLGVAIKKGISYLANLPITGTVVDIAQIIALIQKIMDQYALLQLLIEKLKDPETLLMMLANAKLFNGQSATDLFDAKVQEIKDKFPGVEGLDAVLDNIESLDLCNADFSLEYLLGGIKDLPLTEIPAAVVSLRSKYGGVVTDNLDREVKGDYNALMFKIREGTVKDESYLSKLRDDQDTQGLRHYNEMLTLVNVLAYSYHDDVKKTSNPAEREALRTKYEQNVATELQKNSNTWNSKIVDDFKARTTTIGTAITSDADSIRKFYYRQPQGVTGKYPTTGNNDYGGLSKTSFDLIIYYEVGGESAYNSRYSKPIWPGGASGVTIGIGYDIGHNSPETFKNDWSGIISDSDISRLSKVAGVKGSSAQSLVSSVSDITIPWEAAKAVFIKKTLPRYKNECIRAFPGSDKLHPDAFGSLVSLVFNRGPATTGKNRQEMANIRAALLGEIKVTNIYDYIADQFIAMKRIWANTGLTGLLTRREKEAALVRASKQSSSNIA